MKAALSLFALLTLSGCAGQMAVTNKTMEFNMDAVDNRYARGGLNIAMAPVYAATTTVDYLVFNSIEFWTGENPITEKPSIFDVEGKNYIEINDQLDESLTKAPIK
ncbi:DUF3332 family protein (plasmid) [Photobacterium sp. DA100]|uniref:DUF3332 family protein n=1 Tax=Photobacterium sp. DA100 TaxID=3027472 RepID=UPI002478F89B|nr:DUF3332 family protein [Photobacterium sp. DA100]WEM45360.1 DUF3332 family protein [Photobacterium sp. DA100]